MTSHVRIFFAIEKGQKRVGENPVLTDSICIKCFAGNPEQELDCPFENFDGGGKFRNWPAVTRKERIFFFLWDGCDLNAHPVRKEMSALEAMVE